MVPPGDLMLRGSDNCRRGLFRRHFCGILVRGMLILYDLLVIVLGIRGIRLSYEVKKGL